MYRIYKITNVVNNKIYVGFTKRTLKRRWSKHIFESRRLTPYRSSLYKAMNKYGLDSFKIEEIDFVDSADVSDATERETFWILELQSFKKPIGYNMKISMQYRKEESKDFREQCSKISQGVKRSSKKKFLGVSQRKDGGYYAVIGFNQKYYISSCPCEESAAIFYDKMALFFFGKEARINFEEKRESYLSCNLKGDIERIFMSREERTNKKYVGVNKRIYFRKDGSTVECFSAISKKTGNIGVFSSEKEAAEARDRIILFLNLENSFTKLNFPERKEEFLKENLKEFYEKNLARPKKRALRL